MGGGGNTAACEGLTVSGGLMRQMKEAAERSDVQSLGRSLGRSDECGEESRAEEQRGGRRWRCVHVHQSPSDSRDTAAMSLSLPPSLYSPLLSSTLSLSSSSLRSLSTACKKTQPRTNSLTHSLARPPARSLSGWLRNNYAG